MDRQRSASEAFRKLAEWGGLANVAEDLEDAALSEIGRDVVHDYDIDLKSRAKWQEIAEAGLKRADQEEEFKNYPFENAANVKWPLLTTASLQFAARAYAAIVPDASVVKARVVGEDRDGAKRERGERVAAHMSHQLLNEMPEWEEEMDILLHQIPIVGCAFWKTFYDPSLGRNRSELVPALDFVVNQTTKSLETCPRYTQRLDLYPHEIEDRIEDGRFLDLDYMEASGNDDIDAPHEFLEQHRLIDLDGDGKREPWIVTVHHGTGKVARIQANYEVADLKIVEGRGGRLRLGPMTRGTQFTKVPFLRDHRGGFYDVGFGKLLKSMSETIDTILNQMLDAGHLQNAGGGFIGSGLSLKKHQLRMSPGTYHVVNAPGVKVREAIYSMDHPGPSTVLFQLLGMMIEAGERIASVQDVLMGEAQKQQTATTTLALIEQGMKVYTSIYKRIYRALGAQFGILFKLNARHLPDQVYFTVMDTPKAVAREDYAPDSFDIVPIADPSMVTDMQKLARAQVINEASQNPNWAPLMNQQEAFERYLNAASIQDVPSLMAQPDPAQAQKVAMVEDLQTRGAVAEVAEQEAAASLKDAEAQAKADEVAVRRTIGAIEAGGGLAA